MAEIAFPSKEEEIITFIVRVGVGRSPNWALGLDSGRYAAD